MIFFWGARIIEVIVTSLGFGVIMGSDFSWRWDNKIAKCILRMAYGSWTILLCYNAILFKISILEYQVIIILYFLFLFLFFKIDILLAAICSMLYWGNLLLIRLVIIYISSGFMQQSVHDYAMDTTSFHVLHLLHIYVTIAIIAYIIIVRLRKKKLYISIKLINKKDSLIVFLLLFVEMTIIETVFASSSFLVQSNWRDMTYLLIFLLLVVCVLAGSILYRSYMRNKQYMNLLALKNEMLENKYQYFEEQYEEKRRQIHDSMQQYTLLKRYLSEGKINEAYSYLDEIKERIKRRSPKLRIGITDIDFILYFKVKDAEKYNIRIETEFDIYFSPMDRDDLCILIGNLFDNAIEAVKDLTAKERVIYFKLKTVNKLFFLEICNAYKEQRIIRNGTYITSKADKGMHGLGLMSCKNIVEKYEGDLEICDDGKNFKVEVTIYINRGEGMNERAKRTS